MTLRETLAVWALALAVWIDRAMVEEWAMYTALKAVEAERKAMELYVATEGGTVQ